MLVVLHLVCVALLAEACPPSCACGLDLKGRRQVSCSKGGLQGTIPVKDIDPNIEVLRITAPQGKENHLTLGPVFAGFHRLEEVHVLRSNLPSIGKHSFWGVPSLRILNLTENNISQVQDNNFRGLVNLVELILDKNRIESMSSGTFHHLSELKSLSLRLNNLTSLSPRLFLKLGRLTSLDLSYNQLEHLDSEVFKDVQELRTFSCRGCNLRNINPHMYSLLSNLAHLDLGDNQFKYLDREEFADLRRLVSLKLDGNHFPVIMEGTFKSQSKLQYLNLGRSHIAKVTNHALDNLTALLELDLGFNKLDRLEPVTFLPLGPNLRILHVSGNNIRIEEFTFVLQVTPKLKVLGLAEVDMRGGLPLGLLAPVGGLKHLNLSSNGLTRFPVQILSPVPGLSFLDLSANELQSIDERTAIRLDLISRVVLTDNPWTCDACHILPMLRRAQNASWEAVCWLPLWLRGRRLAGLTPSELGSGCVTSSGRLREDYRDGSLTGQPESGNLGLIAAGSALALLVVTMTAVIASLLYSNKSHHYHCKGKPSNGSDEGSEERKVSISTIEQQKQEICPTEIS